MDNFGFVKLTHTKPRQAPQRPIQGQAKPKREKAKDWQRIDKRAQWQ